MNHAAPGFTPAEPADTYHVHPLYMVLGCGLLGLGSLLGWRYIQDRDAGTLVMTALCLVLASIHLQWLGTRLACTAEGVTWCRLGQARHILQWREIQDVRLVGRVIRHLQIEPAGHNEAWLSLPRMRDQDRLYQCLHRQLSQPVVKG